jgi:hypothetical protein
VPPPDAPLEADVFVLDAVFAPDVVFVPDAACVSPAAPAVLVPLLPHAALSSTARTDTAARTELLASGRARFAVAARAGAASFNSVSPDPVMNR